MWKWHLILSFLRYLSGDDATLARRLHALQTQIGQQLDALSQYWTSTVRRPKRPPASRTAFRGVTEAAVVIQGPLRLEDDFTLETVRHYRRTMPGAKLIVSTWEGEHPAALDAIERAGASVLCSPSPEDGGSANINRQICSTRVGLAAAKQAGYEFILKTRTDTRINSYHVLDYLAGLLMSFPLPSGVEAQARLVVLDFATRLLLPNHPSDLLMFGRLSDMETYWSVPYCTAPHRPAAPPNVGVLCNESTPEIYLCEHYLRKINYPFERTINSWWRTLANLFVVVDRPSIDFFWPKYGYAEEHRMPWNEADRALALCGFRDWMNLYAFPRELPFSEEALRNLRSDELLEVAYNRSETIKPNRSFTPQPSPAAVRKGKRKKRKAA